MTCCKGLLSVPGTLTSGGANQIKGRRKLDGGKGDCLVFIMGI